jgi:hypothetical protein
MAESISSRTGTILKNVGIGIKVVADRNPSANSSLPLLIINPELRPAVRQAGPSIRRSQASLTNRNGLWYGIDLRVVHFSLGDEYLLARVPQSLQLKFTLQEGELRMSWKALLRFFLPF